MKLSRFQLFFFVVAIASFFAPPLWLSWERWSDERPGYPVAHASRVEPPLRLLQTAGLGGDDLERIIAPEEKFLLGERCTASGHNASLSWLRVECWAGENPEGVLLWYAEAEGEEIAFTQVSHADQLLTTLLAACNDMGIHWSAGIERDPCRIECSRYLGQRVVKAWDLPLSEFTCAGLY